jgi:large subunit ribosomal protein L21
MYAVIETGGKQYKVAPGDFLKVEKLEAQTGDQIELDQVLAVSGDDGLSIGEPKLDGAKVKATVLRTAKGKKIVVFKKKRRKGYKKKQGHRQWSTLLRIDEIVPE